MPTHTSEKGLETLIMRHMTGTDGLRPGREIELLREYRTRLVADVVTGKLDVRPAARQLPEEGGELSHGADQSDESDAAEGVDEPDGADRADESGLCDEMPLE